MSINSINKGLSGEFNILPILRFKICQPVIGKLFTMLDYLALPLFLTMIVGKSYDVVNLNTETSPA